MPGEYKAAQDETSRELAMTYRPQLAPHITSWPAPSFEAGAMHAGLQRAGRKGVMAHLALRHLHHRPTVPCAVAGRIPARGGVADIDDGMRRAATTGIEQVYFAFVHAPILLCEIQYECWRVSSLLTRRHNQHHS